MLVDAGRPGLVVGGAGETWLSTSEHAVTALLLAVDGM